MAIDARTMLLLTMGIAVIAAGVLWIEGRTLRSRALSFWSAGFVVIALGCGLSPLREAGFIALGVWVPNSMLVGAHMLFLTGAACFVERPRLPLWLILSVMAGVLASCPALGLSANVRGMMQSAMVACATLVAARVLLRFHRGEHVTRQLGVVLLLHGAWYAIKAGLIMIPGGYGDVTVYEGFVIPLSLLEGILVEVLLALLMVGAVRRRRELEIERLAQRDPLTGVYNRRAFEERATGAIARAAAEERPGALMLLDVDRFKAINDTLGHAMGDRILVALTQAIAPLLPPGALLARLGGDEFVILLAGAGEEQVDALGSAIRSGFTASCRAMESPSVAASVSLGIARFAGDARLADLIARADAAMYEAKRRGRDQHASPTPAAILPHRTSREAAARKSAAA